MSNQKIYIVNEPTVYIIYEVGKLEFVNVSVKIVKITNACWKYSFPNDKRKSLLT